MVTNGWMFQPLAELARLEDEMSDLFDTRHERGDWRWSLGGEFPPMNIVQTDDEIRVTAELPGVDVTTLDLSITGSTLTLRGERKGDEIGDGEAYYRRERPYGAFARSLRLPAQLAGDTAEARYVNGLLELRIPKAEEARSRKISIQSE